MASAVSINDNIEILLGAEFLTWLWFKSETENVFRFKNNASQSPFTVTMEQKVAVRGGEGENVETAIVSGSLSPLREARLGLQTGKLVTSALLRMESEGMEWTLTLKAESFCLNSLKTPPIAKPEPDDDPDALFYEKMYLLDRGVDMLNEIYRSFLEVRLSKEKWELERTLVGKWMLHDISQGTMSNS